MPLIKHFVFSEVLYHEIGHHMQFLQGDNSGRQQEKLAEQYERKLFDVFVEHRYWYVWPFGCAVDTEACYRTTVSSLAAAYIYPHHCS